MRSAAHADLAKYERALDRYFQVPASARKTKDREKILKILGGENTHEFVTMHIPLWEVKIDELLDPTCTDMLPISISHSYVNWVRGAIRLMPETARVKIFSSKLKVTGLRKVILQLLSRMTGENHHDFEVTDVQLVEKVHKDTLFRVRDEKGKEYSLYLSRFGCLREWTWWVDGVARQDALGDCVGTALRYGHYVASPGKKVYVIDNIELFHLDDTDVRIFEPIHDFLPWTAYPDDQGKQDALRARMQADYDKAYRDQMRIIVREWAEVERYLIQMRRHIRTYTGEVFEKVLGNVKARGFGKR